MLNRSSNESLLYLMSSTICFVNNIFPFYTINKGRTNLPESVFIIIYPNYSSFLLIIETFTNFYMSPFLLNFLILFTIF